MLCDRRNNYHSTQQEKGGLIDKLDRHINYTNSNSYTFIR